MPAARHHAGEPVPLEGEVRGNGSSARMSSQGGAGKKVVGPYIVAEQANIASPLLTSRAWTATFERKPQPRSMSTLFWRITNPCWFRRPISGSVTDSCLPKADRCLRRSRAPAQPTQSAVSDLPRSETLGHRKVTVWACRGPLFTISEVPSPAENRGRFILWNFSAEAAFTLIED